MDLWDRITLERQNELLRYDEVVAGSLHLDRQAENAGLLSEKQSKSLHIYIWTIPPYDDDQRRRNFLYYRLKALLTEPSSHPLTYIGHAWPCSSSTSSESCKGAHYCTLFSSSLFCHLLALQKTSFPRNEWDWQKDGRTVVNSRHAQSPDAWMSCHPVSLSGWPDDVWSLRERANDVPYSSEQPDRIWIHVVLDRDQWDHPPMWEGSTSRDAYDLLWE